MPLVDRISEESTIKRPLYLACLLFLMPFTLEAQYFEGPIAALAPSPIWKNSQTPPTAPVYEDVDGLRCFCLTHKTPHKCSRQLTMLGLRDEDCLRTPSIACGHVTGTHTPSEFLDLEADWFRIGGFLTDPRTKDVRRKEIIVGVGPDDPLILKWTYTAGQVTGNHKFRSVLTDPPPLHFFLTPPLDFCESTSSCTMEFTIPVWVPGLIELPAPPFFFSGSRQPIPYVRCGLTGEDVCPGNIDNPHSWPAHRRTHWGTSKTVASLVEVADRWYRACSTYFYDPATDSDQILTPQDLVISDMSVPYGGLFDVGGDWTPSYSGQSSEGHSSHRIGVDIDLSCVSVPSPGACGPRPGSGGTKSPIWIQTRIWTDPDLFEGTKLRPLPDDPGHLRWKKENP